MSEVIIKEMTIEAEEILNFLTVMDINYQLMSHPPLHTCEEARIHRPDIRGSACKNLFVRNKNGQKHYLVVVDSERRADLKQLRKTLGESALSFASGARLFNHLKTRPGSVSPLGLLFDERRMVKVILDRKILLENFVNFHPNCNRHTVELTQVDFLRFLRHFGYQPLIYSFEEDKIELLK